METKSFFKGPFFVGIICFLLGGLSVYTFYRVKDRFQFSVRTQKNVMTLEPFFGEENPFAEMEKLQKSLQGQFMNPEPVGDVRRREDSKYVYFDVLISGLNEENIKINVADQTVHISGEIEKRTVEENGESVVRSNFSQSFPVPDNVDAVKVQMESEKDKIVIKFPKIT